MSVTQQLHNPSTMVQRDLARIRECWQAHKKASPHADPFFFLARIAATGKVRMPASTK